MAKVFKGTQSNLSLGLNVEEEAAGVGGGGTIQPTDSNTYNIRAADEGAPAGNSRGENSVDLQQARITASSIAWGDYSVIVGGRENEASRSYACVLGGLSNASLTDFSVIAGGAYNKHGYVLGFQSSFIGGGNFNTTSGQFSVIGGGDLNTAIGGYVSIIGGRNNYISGNDQTICGGNTNTTIGGYNSILGGKNNTVDTNSASYGFSVVGGGGGNSCHDSYTFVGGGRRNVALGLNSCVLGGREAYTRNFAQQSYAGGMFDTTGDAQVSLLVLRNTVPSGSPILSETLYLDGLSTNIVIPEDFTYKYNIDILAIPSGTSSGAAWEAKGIIARTGNLTSVFSDSITNIDGTPPAWSNDPTIDAFNNQLRVQVSGDTSHALRYVAKVQTVEIGNFL